MTACENQQFCGGEYISLGIQFKIFLNGDCQLKPNFQKKILISKFLIFFQETNFLSVCLLKSRYYRYGHLKIILTINNSSRKQFIALFSWGLTFLYAY